MILTVAIIMTVLGILYILSPIDIIPDFIPILGWIDDLLVAIAIAVVWFAYFGVLILSSLFNTILPISLAILAVLVIFKVVNSISRKGKRRRK